MEHDYNTCIAYNFQISSVPAGYEGLAKGLKPFRNGNIIILDE